MSASKARQLLGLPAGANAPALALAYRNAVKAAHPDRDGGDAERLRQVIDAHRILKSLCDASLMFAPVKRRTAARKTALLLRISVCEALFGGERRIELDGGPRVDVQLPAGLRSGDVLRLAGMGAGGLDVMLRIEIDSEQGLSVRGHDLWLDLAIEPRQLRGGERVELTTPRGPRAFLAPHGAERGAVVRLRGEGLPPRDRRPAGDLIVRLRAADPADESAARGMLRRFSARWAA